MTTKERETAKWTPGPWTAYADNRDRAYIHASRDGRSFSIAEIYSTCLKKELYANARLMASAPELLKVCKAVLAKECMITTSAGYLEYRALEAAIAKAEGR